MSPSEPETTTASNHAATSVVVLLYRWPIVSHMIGREGFRYKPNTPFETFPFPWAPGSEPNDDPRVQVIADAVRELVEKRDRWLNPEEATEVELKKRTLTNLYNERPTWLALAHEKLDKAVFDAYGCLR